MGQWFRRWSLNVLLLGGFLPLIWLVGHHILLWGFVIVHIINCKNLWTWFFSLRHWHFYRWRALITLQHWLPLIRSLLFCLHVGIRRLVFKTLWTSKFVVLIYGIVRILITIVIAFSTLISWVIIIFIFLIIIISRLVWKLRKLIIKVIELVRSTQFIWKVFLTAANKLVWKLRELIFIVIDLVRSLQLIWKVFLTVANKLVWKLRELIIIVVELVRSTQFIWKVFLTVANIRSLVWLLTVLLLHSWLRVLLWILSRKIVLLLSRIVIVRFYLCKWLVEWVRIFLILLVKCVDH